MMKANFILLLLCIGLISCNKSALYDRPDSFYEDFESYLDAESFLGSENFYHQITYTESYMEIDTHIVFEGTRSMKFFGKGTKNNVLSKCSFSHHKLALPEKETVTVSAWYYIDTEDELPWLFLMDMEENVAIGAGPGIRVYISDNNSLGINFKYLEPNIEQDTANQMTVPRKEWFKISMTAYLSQKDNGWIKLYQNDTLVIDAQNIQTLPKDILYFQQGTKGMYTSAEFGVTANPTDKDVLLWVDAVEVFVKE